MTTFGQIHSKTKSLLCILLLFPLALLSIWPKNKFSQVDNFDRDKSFDWDKVPLDYAEPGGFKAAIALLRIPAKNKKNYRGPILFNPGGPGGSGVELINSRGKDFQQLIGDEFDIVGFDPRGVSATTPAVSAFSDNIERAYWTAGTPSVSNSTPETFELAFARNKIQSELIMSQMGNVLEHIGTAAVARDMLAITEAFGQEKLNYWGFSYGSILGSTFSFMFPDKVGRVVIDGVVEYTAYYSGTSGEALSDTDKILTYIYNECVTAGEDCPLYAETPSKVEERLHTILQSLKSKPMAVFDGTNYGIIDYGVTKRAFFQGLHSPFASVGPIFKAFAALEEGNATLMMQMVNHHRFFEPATCTSEPTVAPKEVAEGRQAIKCGDNYCDGDGNCRNTTIESLKNDLEEMSRLSIFADVFLDLTSMTCVGWTVPTREKYGGQFNTTTSFPLLIIGNTYDPVTPLYGARAAAKAFSNSVLMVVDTPGHCSTAGTSPSAMKYIRDYFREGKLPPKGTICPITNKLFGKEGMDLTLKNRNGEDEGWLELVNKFASGAQEYQAANMYQAH
ncbi:hypothetical protein Clacol_000300 [Clathrus columnatus]|uniref:Uncharacterized protein n=1 Tax=Clathrus columnatus TaxID=1419009 RepID=A0AAV5A0K2_9AGAM|nr:hypothetical protein Clacol_000300 [Clathrus columnatus]